MKIKTGIIGASGYVGGELLRLLLFHPQIEVVAATSKRYVGDYVFHLHSNLRGLTDMKFVDHYSKKIEEECELVFFSLPHGASVKMIPDYVDKGKKIIDLSADFRLKDLNNYPKYYSYEHPYPEILKKFVYGVPELHREEIKNSSFIACPGCMAIASILPLAPIIKNNMVETEKIIVDVKIGSSGAGAAPSPATHHAIRYGVIRPYKPTGHRHTAEIEQELNILSNKKVQIAMSAHAVNIVRGILSTCHVFPLNQVTIRDLWKVYRNFFKNEPFIRLVRDIKGLYKLPDPKVVMGSNYCDIGFEVDEHINRIVLFSAIDNLMRGAAGTAIQNMNIMFSFDEKMGLQFPGLHPA